VAVIEGLLSIEAQSAPLWFSLSPIRPIGDETVFKRGLAMERYLTLVLAIAVGLLAGGAFEASRSRAELPSLGRGGRGAIPAVSAAPAAFVQDDRVQFAADVEVEGRRFRVYVGRSDGVTARPVWSVAVPSEE
jgi:hypothetical protein